MIFDTHAHYDEKAFDPDRDELLAAMKEEGVGCIVNVGASPEGTRASVSFAHRYDYFYATAGIHPDDVGALDDALMDELRSYGKDPKVVAIGEIGLDYYWNVETHDVQQEAFRRQLELAKELDLPINVHSRDAAQDTFDILAQHHAGTTGGIIHCYSGSVEMAREYVKRGYYIGVGGVVTFKNGKTLKNVVREIPLERLVTETDCPYLAPPPYRGKRNDSRKIRYVIQEIAKLKEIPEEEAEEALYENARRVYRLN